MSFCTIGGHYNWHRFKTKTKNNIQIARDLLVAEDYALVAHNQTDMQTILNAFSDECKPFELTINITKTELLYTSK